MAHSFWSPLPVEGDAGGVIPLLTAYLPLLGDDAPPLSASWLTSLQRHHPACADVRITTAHESSGEVTTSLWADTHRQHTHNLYYLLQQYPGELQSCLAYVDGFQTHMQLLMDVAPPLWEGPSSHKQHRSNVVVRCPCGCLPESRGSDGGHLLYRMHHEYYDQRNGSARLQHTKEHDHVRPHRVVVGPLASYSVQTLANFVHAVERTVHQPYNQYFSRIERQLAMAACVLLAWKLLDVDADARMLTSAGSNLISPMGTRHSSVHTDDMFHRLRRQRSFTTARVCELEAFVLGRLQYRLHVSPHWWDVMSQTIADHCHCTQAEQALLHLLEEDLHTGDGHHEEAMLRPLPSLSIGLHNRVQRAHCGVMQLLLTLSCLMERKRDTEGVGRMQCWMASHPLMGVALAIFFGGVTVSWVVSHLTSEPSFTDEGALQRSWIRSTLNDMTHVIPIVLKEGEERSCEQGL